MYLPRGRLFESGLKEERGGMKGGGEEVLLKLRIRVGREVKASRLMKGAHHMQGRKVQRKKREQSRNNETGGGASVQRYRTVHSTSTVDCVQAILRMRE